MTQSPLERAWLSLDGLSLGDSLGFTWTLDLPQLLNRTLPKAPWRGNDDTEMAASVVSVLQQSGQIDQNALAASFAEHLNPAPERPVIWQPRVPDDLLIR